MSRKSKQREALAALEADLRSSLVKELRIVESGKNTLFFMTREFNPFGLPEHMLPRSSAMLSDLASDALRLRASLGEPDAAPVASLFRRYLEEANNLADHQRLGPIRLAGKFLAELQALGR